MSASRTYTCENQEGGFLGYVVASDERDAMNQARDRWGGRFARCYPYDWDADFAPDLRN